MWTWLRVAWATFKRELFGYALSPLFYLLAALFLVVQGYSFFLLCQSLSMTRGASGAVFSYFFGGTLLYWLFLLFVVSLLTMRLVSEERQRGSLDLLLSTPAPEGALVFGKFLGALGFYLFLWAPTTSYMALLGRLLGPSGTLDMGPILGGYLGVLLSGASALAVGLLASVLSPTPLISAALSFVSLSLLVLGGLVADLYTDRATVAAVLSYGNMFQHLDELSRGILDSRRVVYHASLAAAVLVVAARCLRTRPGDRAGRLRTALLALPVLLAFVGANLLAARHPLRADLTRLSEHRLSPPLRELLFSLAQTGKQVDVLVLHAEPGGRDELFLRLRETLLRAEQAARGRLRLEWVDVDRRRERARVLAERYHIERDDLQASAVVVECEGRSKLLLRGDLGEVTADAPGEEPRLSLYRGEEALGTALLTVTAGRTPTVCFTRGHGESEHDSYTGTGLSDLSAALSRENLRTRGLLFEGGGKQLMSELSACDVVAVAGPERPFLAEETAALESYLDSGGRLLLLSGALLDRGLQRYLPTGLEELLQKRGVRLAQAVAIDPARRLGESLAFTVDSYGEHPITAGLSSRRTLWPLGRPVLPLAPIEPIGPLGPTGTATQPPAGTGHSGLSYSARVLATTTADGFGETDLSSIRDSSLRFDPASDLPGPVPLAVATQPRDKDQGARIVVVGSTQMAWNDSLVLYNRDFLIAAVKWLADAPLSLAIAPRRPGEIRLVLSSEQQRRLFLVLVLGLPGLCLLLGIGVRFLRRAD
jgi:ABC-2 type transport system permease protein